jgi:hypothetical protein
VSRRGRSLLAAVAALATALTGLAGPAAAQPLPAGSTDPVTAVGAGIAVTPPAIAPPVVTGPVAAAVASQWDAGNIMSDTVFFDPTTMTTPQVRDFLAAKGARCVAGEQPCLKDIRVTTVAKASDGLCRGYTGGLVQSAAEIIVGVAQSCGVNPRVLVVLLEKEQSLVTRTRPTTYAYERATGFGCPDTAPCNAEYFGLFNQVYLAARQYQNYAANPTRYPRYRPGRLTAIQYHPSTACGSSDVYLQNQATAGLYTYTPYQPNPAALANLYGTGDACSAYGNRNFWRLFTDWFGPTQSGGFLVRSPESPTVYLLSGSTKLPIPSLALFQDLAPLGPLGYLSSQYLERWTTGPVLQRAVLDPSGTVYFLDEGKKMPFSTCTRVADYGFSCGSLVPVDAALTTLLATGPTMTTVYRTTSGKSFVVEGGTRREIADEASLTAAGYATSTLTLSEDALNHLPHAAPVTRDGIVIRDRTTGALAVPDAGGRLELSADLRSSSVLAALPVRPLDPAGLALLPVTGRMGPFVVGRDSTSVYFLAPDAKRPVTDAAVTDGRPTPVPIGLLAALPDGATVTQPFLLKGSDRATVWNVREGRRRALLSWDDLVAVSGGTAAPIVTVPPALAGTVPLGTPQLGPGSLVVSTTGGTVYLVDGLTRRIPVGSFSATAELGVGGLRRVEPSALEPYAQAPALLSTAVRCGTQRYLGLGGLLYTVDDDAARRFGLQFTDLQPLSCATLQPANRALGSFLRTPDGTIYLVQEGQKQWIRSMATYTRLGGSAANTHAVTYYAAGRLPSGPAL